MDCRQASTSMLQRRLKLGYSRAARIIDQIEDWQEMKLRRTMPLDKQQ